MNTIKKISFESVPKTAGCCCDKCGQYLQNIYTVTYSNDISYHFGIDCFNKLLKSSSLNSFGMKEFKKLLKRIQHWQERCEYWTKITEEEARAAAAEKGVKLEIECSESAHYGETFEEYKEWMLNCFIAERFKENEKELQRFKGVKFETPDNSKQTK